MLPGLQSSAALFDEAGDAASGALARVSVALAYLSAPTGPDLPAARAALEQGLAGFSGAGDSWGQAMTLVTLGRIDLATQDVPAAAARFDESYRLASSAGEMLGIVIAQHHRGWPKLFSGDVAVPRRTSPSRSTRRSRCTTTRASPTDSKGSRGCAPRRAMRRRPACSSGRRRACVGARVC